MAERKVAAIAAIREARALPAAPVETVATESVSAPREAPLNPSNPSNPSTTPQVQVDAYMSQLSAKQAAIEASQVKATAALTAAERKEAEVATKLRKLELASSNPVEFLAEIGMKDEEWKHFLTSGGELTPEQKRLREVEAQNKGFETKLAEMQRQMQEKDASLHRTQQQSEITAGLTAYPMVRALGGAAAVQEKMVHMSQQTGQNVSWSQAAAVMEHEYRKGTETLLKNPEIAAILKLNSVNQPPKSEPAASKPTTLGRQTAPTTAATNRPNPRDWAAKKAQFLALMAVQRK